MVTTALRIVSRLIGAAPGFWASSGEAAAARVARVSRERMRTDGLLGRRTVVLPTGKFGEPAARTQSSAGGALLHDPDHRVFEIRDHLDAECSSLLAVARALSREHEQPFAAQPAGRRRVARPVTH